MLRLGADREVRGDRQPRRLRLAGAHAAWPRHHGRLRPAQERKPQAARQRTHGRDALHRTGADAGVALHLSARPLDDSRGDAEPRRSFFRVSKSPRAILLIDQLNVTWVARVHTLSLWTGP